MQRFVNVQELAHIRCPNELARDMSAFAAARVRDHARHVLLLEGRSGAGDEDTGSDFAGHGEEDHVVGHVCLE